MKKDCSLEVLIIRTPVPSTNGIFSLRQNRAFWLIYDYVENVAIKMGLEILVCPITIFYYRFVEVGPEKFLSFSI